MVNERLDAERTRMRDTYDEKHRHHSKAFPKVGDRVYMKTETSGKRCPKMNVSWDGPYRVIDVSTTTATIRKGDIQRQVQFDRLRIVEAEKTE